MDLKKELRIIVKYILPKEEHDKDVIENYVDTLALINEEYVKQLRIGGVSQQRELLSDFMRYLLENGYLNTKNLKDYIVQDYIISLNCG